MFLNFLLGGQSSTISSKQKYQNWEPAVRSHYISQHYFERAFFLILLLMPMIIEHFYLQKSSEYILRGLQDPKHPKLVGIFISCSHGRDEF